MNSELVPLRLVLGFFGIETSMEEFDTRLRAQKTVFLAQEAGFHLGYHFGLDEQGPYSFDLADDLHRLVDDLHVHADHYSAFQLPEHLKAILVQVGTVISRYEQEDVPLLDWLRVLATALFACRRVSAKRGESRTVHVNRVLEETGKASLAQYVAPALNELCGVGLL